MNQNQCYQQQAPQMAGLAQEVTNAVNQFDYQQTAQQATQEQTQAKSFLNSFRDYINSHNFTNDVNRRKELRRTLLRRYSGLSAMFLALLSALFAVQAILLYPCFLPCLTAVLTLSAM